MITWTDTPSPDIQNKRTKGHGCSKGLITEQYRVLYCSLLMFYKRRKISQCTWIETNVQVPRSLCLVNTSFCTQEYHNHLKRCPIPCLVSCLPSSNSSRDMLQKDWRLLYLVLLRCSSASCSHRRTCRTHCISSSPPGLHTRHPNHLPLKQHLGHRHTNPASAWKWKETR